MSHQRHYWDSEARLRRSLLVQAEVVDGDAVIHVSVEAEPDRTYRGRDFEEALEALRGDFEGMGRLVLINRFRRDAFVTSMSRQMSNGLECYLFKARRSIAPSMLVACLDPTEEMYVVLESEAAAFIARWQSEPPWDVRFPWLGWLRGR